MTEKLAPKAFAFIDSVLRLQPRLAVFDCDGTLWSGDAGEGFFSWELDQGLVSDEVVRWARPRYADYRAGKVPEELMFGEMVTMHRGMSESTVLDAAQRYFESAFTSRIFPELLKLVKQLQHEGCEVWAVSSTNEWVIRVAMKHFGIPANRILAAAVEVENGIITDRLIRVPSGEGKPQAIREVIRRQPDAAFGNSRWDTEMLAMSKAAFAVNPFVELQQTAQSRGWTIYQPDSVK